MLQRFPNAVGLAVLASWAAFAARSGWSQEIALPPARAAAERQPTIGSGPIGPAPTQEASPAEAITISQLEELAEVHNPTLAQAARQIEAASGQQLQVGLRPNPVIGYQVEEMGENGRAGQHGMFLRQEIVTADKLGLNREVAAREVQQAEWDLQMQRQRVRNDVRSRAYDVLAAQQTVEIAVELVRVGQAAVDVAERLQRARETGQVDVLQARVEANSAGLQLAAARKAHAAAWRRLAIAVGLPDIQPSPLADRLDDDLPEVSWEETSARLLSQSPQLARARAGVERARWAIARACAGRVPNLETAAAIRYNDDSNDTTLSLQLGVPLMIFDRNQGNLIKAHAELAGAQREVERIELVLQDRLAEVYRDYDVAREQVEQYRRDILPDAKQSLELTRRGYEQGEFPYLAVLTAQQTFARTNLAYVDRLRELWLATVQIQGMLLSGGLEMPR